MIIKISLTEKRFYVLIKLRNDLKAFIVDSLMDIGEEGFFFINYQFIRNLEDKMNVSIIAFLKSKKYEIFNRKKTYFITYAIYFFIKMEDYYI